MNKKTIALFSIAAATFGTVAANAEELTANITLGYESEYVFRGVQLADTSIQASVDFAYGDFYGGIWTNQPASDVSVANEIDYYAGYEFVISDLISADTGFTFYQYPDSAGDDTTEVFFGLNLDAAFTPALYVYYDFDTEVITFEASVGHEIELDDKNTIVLGGYVGYADPDDDSSYWYYGATADIVYSLSESASVSLGLRASANDSDIGNASFGSSSNLWGGVSFQTGF